MVHAYVFLETELGKARTVAQQVEKVQGVISNTCHAVTGPYDVIALVQAENAEVLGTLIQEKIQHIPGVRRTVTNVSIGTVVTARV